MDRGTLNIGDLLDGLLAGVAERLGPFGLVRSQLVRGFLPDVERAPLAPHLPKHEGACRVSNVLTMRASRERVHDGAPAPAKDWVDFSDGSGPTRVVAYGERKLPPGGIPAYLAARSSGARSFALWADEHRRERVATLVTLSATGGVATFQAL